MKLQIIMVLPVITQTQLPPFHHILSGMMELYLIGTLHLTLQKELLILDGTHNLKLNGGGTLNINADAIFNNGGETTFNINSEFEKFLTTSPFVTPVLEQMDKIPVMVQFEAKSIQVTSAR